MKTKKSQFTVDKSEKKCYNKNVIKRELNPFDIKFMLASKNAKEKFKMTRIGKLESQKDLEAHVKKHIGGYPVNPPKEPDNLFEDWRNLETEELIERVKKEFGYVEVTDVELEKAVDIISGLVKGVDCYKMEYAYRTYILVRGAKRKGVSPHWRTETIYELYIED